jgi:hypothetical protein
MDNKVNYFLTDSVRHTNTSPRVVCFSIKQRTTLAVTNVLHTLFPVGSTGHQQFTYIDDPQKKVCFARVVLVTITLTCGQ